MSEILVLENVPDLSGRRKVLAALDAFDDVSRRQSDATRSLYDTMRKLENAQEKIRSQIRKIQAQFQPDYEAIDGYPDIRSPYQMHDDHLGCYCCTISGLPLRNDDETVEYGDGEALLILAEQISTSEG